MNIVISNILILVCVHFVSLSCVFAQLWTFNVLVTGGQGSKDSCGPRESAWFLIAFFLFFYLFVYVFVLRQGLICTRCVAQAALKFMAIFLSPVV